MHHLIGPVYIFVQSHDLQMCMLKAHTRRCLFTEKMEHAFSMGLSRWQQQDVDVWVSHKGATTELFCGVPGWRVVMQYANPQVQFNLFSLHLYIPSFGTNRKEKGYTTLQIGEDVINITEKQWERDELYEMRWGVISHNTSKETASVDDVRNSLDIRLDMFALMSLVAQSRKQGAKQLHLENLKQDKPIDLINVWFTQHIECKEQFVDTLRCASYGLYSKTKGRVLAPTPRFSLVLPIDMLVQCVALVECCTADDFRGADGNIGSGLLRISMDGTTWLCTDTSSCKLISAVCCDSLVEFK